VWGRTRAAIILLIGLSLAACGTATVAPVQERVPSAGRARGKVVDGYYVVARDDTLYSIAWNQQLDYKDLARWNGIDRPYVIYPGDRLRLSSPPPGQAPSTAAAAVAKRSDPIPSPMTRVQPTPASPPPVSTQAPSVARPLDPPPESVVVQDAEARVDGKALWQWPARGQIIRTFPHKGGGKKGIVIAGQAGQPIRAAADGKVVYSGSGLVGYGKLIILKHNNAFLSAYAHNRKLLVSEGERVEAGQIIAEMGSTGTDRPMLHFEIRHAGQPVDPLAYLPKP
jgi:lipoprotein NlpD